MNIYCTPEFIIEFTKINKKKQYKDFENLVLDYFLNNSFQEIATGDRLYGPNEIPFIKKRLPDSSGYRLYFLADTTAKDIYINFAHPKRPPLGYENIGIIKKKELHDTILISRKTKVGLLKLSRCAINNNAVFTPQ